MTEPKPKIDITQDDTTISPNGDTTAERYKKAKERDAKMTTAERLEKLREGAKRFNELLPDFYDEGEDNAED